MRRMMSAVWLATLATAAQAGSVTTRDSLHLSATYGSSRLGGYSASGERELSGFELGSGVVAQDAEGRIYYDAVYGLKMNSIGTPDYAPFKLYSLGFKGSIGLGLVDLLLHPGETQWPRWIDRAAVTVGFGIPVFASDKVFHSFGSNVMTYSYCYGLRYYFSPNVDISFTTEKFDGLIIGDHATSATTNGMEIEYSF